MTDVPDGAPGEDPSASSQVVMDGSSRDSSSFTQIGIQNNFTGPVSARAVTMRTLPRDVAAFTGRDAELRQLMAAAAGPTGVIAIHTVDGMPGVGKTALVTRAAHLLADAFPDGQLFIRLHAHTPGLQPPDAGAVLAELLACTGMTLSEIPAGTEARAARWRDRLAGKKVLLVLDDAVGHAQVRPLLPGSADCLVMVTSRRRLIALDGAEPLSLDTLPPAEARELFTGVARRTPAGAEESAVDELIRLCGYLPLAIALLAGRLAHHPSWTISAFAADFGAAKDRLAELSAGDRAVAAAFELSYRDLPPGRRRLFRRLGLHPGHDYDAYAAAALDDIPLTQARRELEALYTDHLIGEPASGRYRFHDLIREYARNLADSRESTRGRSRARTRLLDYYQHSAQVADEHLARHTRPGSPLATPAPSVAPELTDRASALTWMRAEQANLMACLDYATASGQPARIIALAAAMAAFLRQQGLWSVAAAMHRTAAAAARRIGDPLREVNALWELGSVRRLMGDFPAAAELLERSLALYRGIGDQRGEASALRELGRVRRQMGDFSIAAGLMERALEIYRETTSRLSEASVLRQLGSVRRQTGNYPAAAGLLEQALAIYRDLGDQLGEAGALGELGSVHRLTGDFSRAAELLERSLALYRDTGSDLGEANSCSELGCVRRLTGDFPAAAELLERSLALYRGIGDQRGEAGALRELGCVGRLMGDFPAAAELLERSLALYRGTDDHLGSAEALNSMAALRAESAGSGEGLALYRRALDHARQVHTPLEEARALEGTARCEARAGNRAAALAALSEAVAIYQAIGAAERNSAVSYLDTLEGEARNDTPLSGQPLSGQDH